MNDLDVAREGAMGFTGPLWMEPIQLSVSTSLPKCPSLYVTEEDILVLRMKWKVPLSVNMDGSRSPFRCSLSLLWELDTRSAKTREFTNREWRSPPACHHEDTRSSIYPYSEMNASLFKTLKLQGNRGRWRTQALLFICLACTASDESDT